MALASNTYTFTGRKSILTEEMQPPIDLSDGRYMLGLVSFNSWNSIPNIDNSNNKFVFYISNVLRNRDGVMEVTDVTEVEQGYSRGVIEIPIGAYEIINIDNYLRNKLLQEYPLLKEHYHDVKDVLSIEANLNTQHIMIKSSCLRIDFTEENTIQSVLGFSKTRVLEPNILHLSDGIAQISKIQLIRIDCDITSGAYHNGKPARTIYEFPLRVPAGFSINESPRNMIYFPIVYNRIDSITLSIVDQDGNLVDFRDDVINVRVEVKKEWSI